MYSNTSSSSSDNNNNNNNNNNNKNNRKCSSKCKCIRKSSNSSLVFGQKAISKPVPKPLRDRILMKLAGIPAPEESNYIIALKEGTAMELGKFCLYIIIDKRYNINTNNFYILSDLPRGVKRQLQEEEFEPQPANVDGSWPALEHLIKRKKLWFEGKAFIKAQEQGITRAERFQTPLSELKPNVVMPEVEAFCKRKALAMAYTQAVKEGEDVEIGEEEKEEEEEEEVAEVAEAVQDQAETLAPRRQTKAMTLAARRRAVEVLAARRRALEAAVTTTTTTTKPEAEAEPKAKMCLAERRYGGCHFRA
ncbi:hypothetical protein F4703DRAFT_1296619 [Phycomyces blakesleeanus]